MGLPNRARNFVERTKLYYGKAPNSRGEGGAVSGSSSNREGDHGDGTRTGRYETAPKSQNCNAADGYPTPGERERMDQPPYQTQPNREIIAPRNRSLVLLWQIHRWFMTILQLDRRLNVLTEIL